MIVDKNLIKKRFSKALPTYDHQSGVQDRVARRLLTLLERTTCTNPQRVLEVGCCTGLLSRSVIESYPDIAELWCNDLVDGAEAPLRKKLGGFNGRLEFLAGDVERMELPQAMDLVISSSTFHWFSDLPGFLAKLSRIVRPGGYLAFAMYGPDNLLEIREIAGVGLDYPEPGQLFGPASEYFQLISYESRRELLYFPTVRTLLEHLRETGVNALDKKVWGPGKLRRFISEYEKHYKEDNGVRLTYHPIYYLFRRR